MYDEELVELYFKTVEDRPYLGWFLQGHLVIEFFLQKIIIAYDNKLENLVSSLNHARMIK